MATRPWEYYDNRERRIETPEAAIKRLLENACDQQGRHYEHHISFSIRFEGDNTSAAKDTQHFQHILKLLQMAPAKELVVDKKEKSPIIAVNTFLAEVIDCIARHDGRTLLLGHYAGHGDVDTDGSLLFSESGDSTDRCFWFAETFANLTGQASFLPQEDLGQTDVVMILDSCHSGVAAEDKPLKIGNFGPDGKLRFGQIQNQRRTTEIIAAVGPDDAALGNHPDTAKIVNRTFTSRLADQVARDVGKGARFVSFPEIVAKMQRDKMYSSRPLTRLPEYHRILGDVPISIPRLKKAKASGDLPTRSHGREESSDSWHSAKSTPARAPSGVNAMFRIHIDTLDPHSDEIRSLLEWIQLCPKPLCPKVVSCVQGNSVDIMMLGPWEVWVQLKYVAGFELICQCGPEIFPHIPQMRFPQVAPQQQTQATLPEQLPFRGAAAPGQPGSRKENVPPVRASGSGVEQGESSSSGGPRQKR